MASFDLLMRMCNAIVSVRPHACNLSAKNQYRSAVGGDPCNPETGTDASNLSCQKHSQRSQLVTLRSFHRVQASGILSRATVEGFPVKLCNWRYAKCSLPLHLHRPFDSFQSPSPRV